MKKHLTIGLSVAALALAGTAYAQQGGRFGPDADGNGIITRAEAQSHAASMFSKLDANKDGKLDKTDSVTRREEMRSKMFAAMDADSNGAISRDEFMSFEHPGKGDGDGKRHRMGKGHRGGGMARMADANNDGTISKAEFDAAALKRFDAMDANHDGQVSKEERQAHRQEMRGKWHEKMQDRDES